MTTANTISLDRLIKIAVITAIAFVVGFLGMWVLNGIAMGIGAAGGGHPSGRGNMSSQLVAGGIVAALGALVAAWWTRHDKDTSTSPRVQLKAVAIGLLVAVLVPVGIAGWSSARENAAERQRLLRDLVGGGKGAIPAAELLVRTTRGGHAALRRLLADAEAPAEARLIAGLQLAQYGVATAADLQHVEALIERPGPLRVRFVQIYATVESVGWSAPIEQWLLAVLDDPEPAMRAGALRALLGHSFDGPREAKTCPARQRLASDSDPGVRAEAMLLVAACPRDQIPKLLKAGTQDPEPAVRLAVLNRLRSRIGSIDDIPAETAIRQDIANLLLNDPDPGVRTAAAQHGSK